MTKTNGTINQLLDVLQLDIKLTEQQIKALEVLDWLYGFAPESYKTGRTTTMALAAIKTAMDYPGIRIALRDHYFGADDVADRVVRGLLQKMSPELRSRFTISRHNITFRQRAQPEKVDVPIVSVPQKLHFDVFRPTLSGRFRSDQPNRSLAEVQALRRFPYGT